MPCCLSARTRAGLYVPENLDLESLNIPRHLRGPVLYLVHAIIMQNALDDRPGKNNGYAPLHAKTLRKIVGRDRCLPAIQAATDCDVLEVLSRVATGGEVVESYLAGEWSKHYRLVEPHASDKWRLRRWSQIGDWRLSQQVDDWRRSEEKQLWKAIEAGETPRTKEIVNFLWDQLVRVAIDDVIDVPLSNVAEVAVDMIRQGQFRLKPDKYGRIHTNISNLRKDLRESLSVEGHRLENLDIANSQPMFMALAAVADYGPRKWPSDLKDYVDTCLAGEFYETLKRLLGEDVSRDQIKTVAFAAFFGPIKPWLNPKATQAEREQHRLRCAAIRVLRENFPSFMDYAEKVKRENYANLARNAQRTESSFIYDRVIHRWMQEKPTDFIATIHDSLLVQREDADDARNIMQEEFQTAYGNVPTIRM